MNRHCYNVILVCITTLLATQICGAALSPLSRVNVMLDDGSVRKILQHLSNRALVGSYYTGDGLGYNLYLTLEASGQYQCEWNGCNRSQMGTASGKWSIDKDGLNFVTEKSEGMFKERPLKTLHVLMLKSQYLFMDERRMEYFREFGVDSYCCFHQEKARQILEQHKKNMREKRFPENAQDSKKTDKQLAPPPLPEPLAFRSVNTATRIGRE